MNVVRKKILLEGEFGKEMGREISCQSLCIEIAYQKEIVYRIHIAEEKEESTSFDDFAQKVFGELTEYFA